MEYNEELVNETENTEELAAENVVEEYTDSTEPKKAEEIPVKTYTEEEFNSRLDELLSKKLARKEAKIRREYEDKYSKYLDAESVLNAGLGTSNIEEATNNLREYYENKGVVIPQRTNNYDERVINLIANDDANKIIEAGYEDIVEEVDRLAKQDLNTMSLQDKILFTKLAEKRKEIESVREIEALGVSKETLEEPELKNYFEKLNPNLSLKEKYEMYLSTKPKEKIESIGSMKTTNHNTKKEFYTEEEISRLTESDLDDPDVWNAVMNSLQKPRD